VVTQSIVGIVQKNPKEAIVHNIWIAILPKIKDWLETSGKHKQKVKIELIFKSEDLTSFSLVSEVSQHDEFRIGTLVGVDISKRTGLEQMSLTQRLEHAEKSIKPIILETLATKRATNRSLKIRVSIGAGVCRWIEKSYGVETSDFDD